MADWLSNSKIKRAKQLAEEAIRQDQQQRESELRSKAEPSLKFIALYGNPVEKLLLEIGKFLQPHSLWGLKQYPLEVQLINYGASYGGMSVSWDLYIRDGAEKQLHFATIQAKGDATTNHVQISVQFPSHRNDSEMEGYSPGETITVTNDIQHDIEQLQAAARRIIATYEGGMKCLYKSDYDVWILRCERRRVNVGSSTYRR